MVPYIQYQNPFWSFTCWIFPLLLLKKTFPLQEFFIYISFPLKGVLFLGVTGLVILLENFSPTEGKNASLKQMKELIEN